MAYKDKNKQREYQRQWIKNRRKEFFQDKSCKLCNATEKLELHHKNPKEKVSHKIWSWTKEKRNKEIQKCEIFCKSCHSKYHHPRSTTHGTLTMYKNHKCRCDKCKKKNAQYEYNRRHRG